ncbi:MAG: AMP-binding protein [Treponema sp.]|nr:AMP-binding protein [Treponema sp.]
MQCNLQTYCTVKHGMVYLEKMTLAELSQKAVIQYSKRMAFEIYRDGHTYNRITYQEFGLRTRQFAALLISLGVRAGDRVMLLAENRPEWPIAYFAAALAGAVTVPVLTDFSSEQIITIASHAGISALCITEKTSPKLTGGGIDPAIPFIYIDSIEEADNGPVAKVSIQVVLHGRKKRLPLQEGGAFPETRETDLATLIYTSGTTGSSKGVMLSHRNLLYNVLSSRSLMKIFPRDRLLSIIPLAHTYECTLGLLNAVMNGASTVYLDRAPAPSVLFPAIQALRPTAMVTVPLFIEKIYRNRIAPALLANPLYRFPLTRFLAIAWAGRTLMSTFGKAIRFFGIGGAPLSEDTEAFLRKVKFPYAPGYGLTEAAPLVSGTAPYHFPFRSAGSVLKDIEVRIVPNQAPGDTPLEGEIQVRGPNVMMGYYRDEEKTREAFTVDGWFKTGDLGFLDKRGHLFIRGRLKALILGPSGENIYPEEIEGLLSTSHLVEDALVYPSDKGELIALVVLSEKAKTMLAAIEGRLEDLKTGINKQLASFSRIHRIEIRYEPFEKTSTLKIKRFLYPGAR